MGSRSRPGRTRRRTKRELGEIETSQDIESSEASSRTSIRRNARLCHGAWNSAHTVLMGDSSANRTMTPQLRLVTASASCLPVTRPESGPPSSRRECYRLVSTVTAHTRLCGSPVVNAIMCPMQLLQQLRRLLRMDAPRRTPHPRRSHSQSRKLRRTMWKGSYREILRVLSTRGHCDAQ